MKIGSGARSAAGGSGRELARSAQSAGVLFDGVDCRDGRAGDFFKKKIKQVKNQMFLL